MIHVPPVVAAEQSTKVNGRGVNMYQYHRDISSIRTVLFCTVRFTSPAVHWFHTFLRPERSAGDSLDPFSLLPLPSFFLSFLPSFLVFGSLFGGAIFLGIFPQTWVSQQFLSISLSRTTTTTYNQQSRSAFLSSKRHLTVFSRSGPL